MTTRVRQRLYLAQHLAELEGKGFAIHNPGNLPLEDLPAIYGFNNGGPAGMYLAIAIAADGTVLGSHGCSDEGYMPNDLGMLEGTRPDRHETFRKHYPDGYRMEFIPSSERDDHPGLSAALELNKAKKDPQQ